jgi:hypothetical protein
VSLGVDPDSLSLPLEIMIITLLIEKANLGKSITVIRSVPSDVFSQVVPSDGNFVAMVLH